MSSIKKALMASSGGAGLDVDEVFSTYLYKGTGTAASSTQTVTNGIDLSGEGGLIWIKDRGTKDHYLFDTERGAWNSISTNSNDAQDTNQEDKLSAFNSNGFTLTGDNSVNQNYSNPEGNYASWTFRKAPKFFDVVTYTGNGTAGRTVAHNLGSAPGCIILKRTSVAENWYVYHRGNNNGTNPEDYYLKLNGQNAKLSGIPAWNDTAPTDSVFSLGDDGGVNGSNQTYVAYLFAHNDGDGEFGPDGGQDIIKCDKYLGGAASKVDIDCGFEPSWVMIKSSNGASDWVILDNMRGVASVYSGSNYLEANTGNAEAVANYIHFTPTGFQTQDNNQVNGYGEQYTYIAIRRGSLFPPEAATEVFTPIAAGSDAALFNAPHIVDHGVIFRPAAGLWQWTTRLLGNKKLNSSETTTLSTGSLPDNLFGQLQTGLATSGNSDYVGLCWRRAPSVFDAVAYSGTGSNRTIPHNLGVVPEMIWIKCTTSAQAWACYSAPVGNTHYQVLNTEALPVDNATYWNDTTPTDEVFSLGNASPVNAGNSGREFIAYLFASLAGVSKIGSYTGNGSNQNIDCGFSNGARFVMVKRISGATGPWWSWNTVSGLVAGNDNALQFNADPQYSNHDSIDPYSAGFNIVQNLNIDANVNGASYLFYAIA